MLTTDRRPTLIAMVALIGLMFPFLSGIDRRPAEALANTTPATAPVATVTDKTPPKATPPPPLSACAGLPMRRRACVEHFVSTLQAFAFPRAAFQSEWPPPEPIGDCTAIPEPEPPLAIAIVTLPDPVKSGLRYQYDRALEAVIQGIEARGYERDRFWLPWARETAKGAVDAKSELDCSDDFPGLLMFRPSAKLSQAPAVAALVVGETPTWGVNRRALYTALNFVRANRSSTVRILGPYFSGASRSLRDTIGRWYADQDDPGKSRPFGRSEAAPAGDDPGKSPGDPRASKTRFRIVSGTATSPNNPSLLESKAQPAIEFSATTLNDRILEREFYRYLERVVGRTQRSSQQGRDFLPGVAVLSESGTAYGNRSPGGASDDPLADVAEPEVTIRFPLHIAAVRAEYQQRQTHDKPVDLAIPLTSLDPIFDDPIERRDTPPILSSETTIADDLVLGSELTALSQRGIRFIGINATDVADILFLAHHVWEVLPDMRLFTFNHELLFAHPELGRELQGMIVASPYALFASSHAWIHPYDDRSIFGFSSSEAQGVYNASIAVFDGTTGLPAARLVGYARPFAMPKYDSGPPVWLSAVGMNGLWPLSCAAGSYLPNEHVYAQALAPIATDEGPIVRPARSWPFVALVLLGLCLWQLVSIGYVLFVRDPSARMPRALRSFRAFRLRGDWTFERLAWACLALGALASTGDMIGALAFTMRLIAHGTGPGHRLVEGAIVLLAAANAAIAPILLGRLLSHAVKTAPDGASRARRVGLAALTFFVPIAIAAVGGSYMQSGAGAGTLNEAQQLAVFFVRSTSFGSRLSPVVPMLLLFLASYVFCFVHLERLRLSDNPYFDMATSVVGQALAPTRKATASDPTVWRLKIADSEWPKGAWVIVILAALIPSYALTVKPLSTLEGPFVDRVFFCCFVFVIAMIAVGAVRFFLVFRCMRALLFRVEEPRLLGALERIPKQVVGFGSPYRVQVDHLLRLRQELYRHDQSFAVWSATGSDSTKLPEAAAASSGFDAGAPSSSPLSEDDARKSTEVIRAKIEPLLSAVLKAVAWARDQPAYALPQGGAAQAGKYLAPGSDERKAADAAAWLEAAEEFVASNVAIVVQCFGSQMRNLLELMVGGALIMALASSSYVFQPDRLLAAIAGGTFLSVAAMALYSFVQLARSHALNRLLKAPFGGGTFRLVGEAFVWVFVPLGAFLAAQYPHTSNQLLVWLSPVLAAFR